MSSRKHRSTKADQGSRLRQIEKELEAIAAKMKRLRGVRSKAEERVKSIDAQVVKKMQELERSLSEGVARPSSALRRSIKSVSMRVKNFYDTEKAHTWRRQKDEALKAAKDADDEIQDLKDRVSVLSKEHKRLKGRSGQSAAKK